ncbi:MAG: hypothetical protein OXL97_02225 [Chloroflexota bacterium]|nr:hypothetical protein [Chloroflexota bacterium]MDE2884769.1 hypothetical protein [Chloroflexota bacterium]
MGFLKRLVIWTAIAVPLGIAIGALVSLTWGPDSDIDRATAGFNGAIAGFWLGLIGALSAATTTRIAREPLRRAGGSECLTGGIIVFGLLAAGLWLLTRA